MSNKNRNSDTEKARWAKKKNNKLVAAFDKSATVNMYHAYILRIWNCSYYI